MLISDSFISKNVMVAFERSMFVFFTKTTETKLRISILVRNFYIVNLEYEAESMLVVVRVR